MLSEAASGPSKGTGEGQGYEHPTEAVEGLRTPYNRSHAAVYALAHYRLLIMMGEFDRMSA